MEEEPTTLLDMFLITDGERILEVLVETKLNERACLPSFCIWTTRVVMQEIKSNKLYKVEIPWLGYEARQGHKKVVQLIDKLDGEGLVNLAKKQEEHVKKIVALELENNI